MKQTMKQQVNKVKTMNALKKQKAKGKEETRWLRNNETKRRKTNSVLKEND